MNYFSIQRLFTNWVYGGFLASFLLFGFIPLFAQTWSLAMLAVFIQLPIYMLHQFEEHDKDRFRKFANEVVGQGKEVLSLGAVFVINIFGVWGVNLICIWLAVFCNIGFGLIAIYLTLINAVAHIGQGLALRKYNPGLVTAVLLFLPVSIGAIWILSPHTTWYFHLLGIFCALAIHAGIIAYVMTRKKALTK